MLRLRVEGLMYPVWRECHLIGGENEVECLPTFWLAGLADPSLLGGYPGLHGSADPVVP